MTGLGSRYSATAGLPFDDVDLESRLVWIWGSPRSGSTWLLEQLCHPLKLRFSAPAGFTANVRQDDSRSRREKGFDVVPVDEPFIANHLAPAFGDPVEAGDRFVPATPNNRLGDKPGYALSHPFEDVWRPEFRRLSLVRLHSIAARAAAGGIPLVDAPVIVIKEVGGSHASDLVMSLLPRSRMVFLARDGRDVVDSLLAAYAPGGFFERLGRSPETPEERLEFLRWASRLWACNVDVTLRAHDAHRPELRRIVRYEDLVADTAGTVGPLFEWLGLRRDGPWLGEMVAKRSFGAVPADKRGKGRRARSASPGLWQENLSEDEQRTAMEIMGPRLERLGYEA